MTTATRNEMIESLWARLHETLDEIDGKVRLRGTPWYDDRAELCRGLLEEVMSLEADA